MKIKDYKFNRQQPNLHKWQTYWAYRFLRILPENQKHIDFYTECHNKFYDEKFQMNYRRYVK